MASAQTFFSFVSENPDVQKSACALVMGLGILGIGYAARRKIEKDEDALIIPSPANGWFNVVDLFLGKFLAFYDSVMGRDQRRHFPLVVSLFIFVLFSNLLGLVPGMPAITTSVWINVALAFLVFFHFNWQGIKEHGFLSYMRHFGGPVLVLAPLVFPIEIISTLLRILTLNLRLYWNITADHIILDLATSIAPYFIPVLFLGFGTFVSFMQAFIFATLTMVYILLATQHEESDHH